jgi:hypothetical protein
MKAGWFIFTIIIVFLILMGNIGFWLTILVFIALISFFILVIYIYDQIDFAKKDKKERKERIEREAREKTCPICGTSNYYYSLPCSRYSGINVTGGPWEPTSHSVYTTYYEGHYACPICNPKTFFDISAYFNSYGLGDILRPNFQLGEIFAFTIYFNNRGYSNMKNVQFMIEPTNWVLIGKDKVNFQNIPILSEKFNLDSKSTYSSDKYYGKTINITSVHEPNNILSVKIVSWEDNYNDIHFKAKMQSSNKTINETIYLKEIITKDQPDDYHEIVLK